MTILVTGSIPGLINENTPLWEWMGQLRLTVDPGLIRYVDITGMGGNFFDATLNRSTGMIAITPIAVLDYEWLVANRISPVLDLTLRFFMMDGTIETSSSSYSVQVLDLDDTPPQSLTFSSGGKADLLFRREDRGGQGRRRHRQPARRRSGHGLGLHLHGARGRSMGLRGGERRAQAESRRVAVAERRPDPFRRDRGLGRKAVLGLHAGIRAASSTLPASSSTPAGSMRAMRAPIC